MKSLCFCRSSLAAIGVLFTGAVAFADNEGGQVWGFGQDFFGALGDGASGRGSGYGAYDYTFAPVPAVGLPTNAVKIDAGWNYNSAAVTADGRVWTCGFNMFSVVLGRPGALSNPTWGEIEGFTNAVDVSAGYDHILVATADGRVFSWGANNWGQLGNGTMTATGTPVQVVGLTNIVAVVASWYHSKALSADGKVYAWGYNSDAELGQGYTSWGSAIPLEVPVSGIRALSSGYEHVVALSTNGTVLTWGACQGGGYLVPTPVAGLTNIKAVATGFWHSLAVQEDGSVWQWDAGSAADIAVVTGLADVVSVAGGDSYSLAVRADGTLWGWGENYFGQLGDGTGVDRDAPTRIKTLAGVMAVSAGRSHSFAVALPDSDADGIGAGVENGAPNDGDGNLDGVADSGQPHVTSLPNAVDGSYVTLCSPSGSVLRSVSNTAAPWPVPLDGLSYPIGLFSFTVDGLALDGTTTVTLLLPPGTAYTSYWKYGPTPDNIAHHWYEFLYNGTTGAEILSGPDRVVLHFADGLRGDDDLTADGKVTDIGGPSTGAVKLHRGTTLLVL